MSSNTESIRRLRGLLDQEIHAVSGRQYEFTELALQDALLLARNFRNLYPSPDDAAEPTGIEGSLWKEVRRDVERLESTTNKFIDAVDRADLNVLLMIEDPEDVIGKLRRYSDRISKAKTRIKRLSRSSQRVEWLNHTIKSWARIWTREFQEKPTNHPNSPFQAFVAVLLDEAGVDRDPFYLIRRALQRDL